MYFVLKTKQLNGEIDIREKEDFARIVKNKRDKLIRPAMYNLVSENYL